MLKASLPTKAPAKWLRFSPAFHSLLTHAFFLAHPPPTTRAPSPAWDQRRRSAAAPPTAVSSEVAPLRPPCNVASRVVLTGPPSPLLGATCSIFGATAGQIDRQTSRGRGGDESKSDPGRGGWRDGYWGSRSRIDLQSAHFCGIPGKMRDLPHLGRWRTKSNAPSIEIDRMGQGKHATTVLGALGLVTEPRNGRMRSWLFTRCHLVKALPHAAERRRPRRRTGGRVPVPAHDGMERAQASAGSGGVAHRAERELLDRGRVAARRSERAAESAGARAGTGNRAKAKRGRKGGVCVARNGQRVRRLESDVEIFDLEEEGSPCQLPGRARTCVLLFRRYWSRCERHQLRDIS